jgi:hypothetical protein
VSDPVVENLILDVLEWLAKQDRSYEETMDAWRTSCPKLNIPRTNELVSLKANLASLKANSAEISLCLVRRL